MKRKNKNAFTLIELLAVIVILAVIALIATPIILGIVEDAKKDAFLRSVELLVSTTDIDIANKTFEESYTYEVTNGDVSNLEVSVKNTTGMNGTITYDYEGKEVYAIHNGVYCVKKTAEMSKAEISDYVVGECILEVVIPTAESCFETEDIEGGVTITKYVCSDKDVIIPSKIGGKTVLSITGYQEYDDEGDLVTVGAFQGIGITSVKFPNTVTVIGRDAFYYNELTSIGFSSSLTKIENRAFAYNKLSGELDLSNTRVTSIGESAFYGTSDGSTNQITSVKFPNSIASIGYRAFANNSLTSMVFYGRSDLTGIVIDDDSWPFNNQYYDIEIDGYKLEIICFETEDIEGGVAIIKYACSDKDVIIPNEINGKTVLSIDGYEGYDIEGDYATIGAFQEIGITSVQIPNTVTTIGNYAFYDNELTSIELPVSIKSIGKYAFSYNKLNSELDLSHLTNLSSINEGVFYGNEITSIKLSHNVNYIGESAFAHNDLTSVTFYGRSDLTGVNVQYYVWGWASGYDYNNIYFVNE